MSTRALEEVLSDFGFPSKDPTSPRSVLAAKARAELAAIRKAAKTLDAWNESGGVRVAGFLEAMATLCAIAKEDGC